LAEDRLARECGRYDCRSWCRQKQRETAKSQKDEQAERYQNTEQFDGVSGQGAPRLPGYA